mgnify:FL=1
MNSNPNNLGHVKYLRLLSHQRPIANYLGYLFGEDTVVRYTVLHGFRELIPHLIYRTVRSYLQESNLTPGFLIDLGDTYSVAYNDRRPKLFVCGFWVTGKNDEVEADQIRAYINLIPRHKALPPIPPGIHYYDLILKYPDDE